ncbi:aldehyde dehydrogenase family protein [Cuneatibacter sp. NSJ-177]|uniref:aldehyde dehydrogenase family protein n=1 Tax=Cuneatibacter sp. NSJ-177 TaxID=2931401 RepID=UPI001FD5F82C|nr:aldehyde dehydrogenase family protein [Cuneatibacter sp. NSJ-177]
MNQQELLDHLVANARVALKEFEPYTQEQVDELIKAICLAFKEHALEFSKEVVEETGLGDYDSKVIKNTGSPDGVWYALKGKKSVGIIGEDKEQGLKYVATPKGILSSVAPTTNPNITVLFNAAFGLKGRNVLIVAPHPRAKKTTMHTVQVINDALAAKGAPKNLVQCIEEPSIELTQLLMQNSDVIIATGGAGMVKSAYSSGHPAFGVGPGNVQTIFDRDYDYPLAVAQTVEGRKLDNGLICACNQSFIIPEEEEENIVACMKEQKVYYVGDPAEVDQFRKVLFPDGRHINKDVVGQSVRKIAGMAGVTIPEDTSIIVLKVDRANAGAADPLCGEKMCPVAIEITYDTFKHAVEIAKANLLYEGAGHSAVVHTNDPKKAEYCGTTLPVSRMLVNQPGVFAANPALANGLNPTSTLGCGSWGNNSISENLTYEHLINISRISCLKDESTIPTQEQIWED